VVVLAAHRAVADSGMAVGQHQTWIDTEAACLFLPHPFSHPEINVM
jgi:hypothetical protein